MAFEQIPVLILLVVLFASGLTLVVDAGRRAFRQWWR